MPLKLFLCLNLLLFPFIAPAQIKSLDYLGVESSRVHKVDFEKVTVIVGLRFYNPNKIGVTLKEGDMNAYFNNHYLGKGIIDERTSVPAQDTFIIPVAITATLESVFTNAMEILSSSNKKVMVKLDGSIKAGKAGIYFRIPVKYEGEQELNF